MKCKYCDKEYKLERYLVKHEESCNKEVRESLEELVTPKEIDCSPKTDIAQEKLRRLTKLSVTIGMCYDAEVKSRLEKEYIDLGGDIALFKKNKEVKFV